MTNKPLNISEVLNIFWSAPSMALFDQKIVALVLQKSTASLERDRFVGSGIPFKKMGRLVRYAKQDVLDWLQKSAPTVVSTTQHQLIKIGEKHDD
jgi:hypothetical protein